MTYDPEQDSAKRQADYFARLDAANALLEDERVLRLMFDPIYVQSWMDVMKAARDMRSAPGPLARQLAMLMLATLDQYKRDGVAQDILALAFDQEDPTGGLDDAPAT